MSWSVTTPPSEEPIAIELARQHLRCDANEDALVSLWITAARQHVEAVCERALMPQEWTESVSVFPPGQIALRGGHVRSVVSLKYTDTDGNRVTMPETDYVCDVAKEPAVLSPVGSWPTGASDVAVLYAVGYEDAASVPAPLRAAMLLILGDLYENRQQVVADSRVIIGEIPTVKRLLFPWRRVIP